ncbi:hypothetical protein NC653_013316 [Populus alba x Populus x berolinensis]|uniref:Uncharacterized protein n=1 Tax=Populus alba x Populus x berolinensis TaxID=444605 RepID=A0AAD6QU25_9ROSI|nr:hypothetical protein NC653_013290 [Populus alba x Populus x berolinensis]KAJ6996673.1 hypothetical protein NC653_013316 [Populus alba x Populus x berolinensis]
MEGQRRLFLRMRTPYTLSLVLRP